MTTLKNNFLGVRFDSSHNRIMKIGGIELLLVHKWHHDQFDESAQSKLEENTNYLDVHPQIATIEITNEKYNVSKGDKVFLHYMAYETGIPTKDLGEGIALINGDYVFCIMRDNGELQMMNDIYFGELVYEEEVISPGGIILTISPRTKANHVRLTNAPENGKYKAGELIFTIDNYQYQFSIGEKKLIMVRDREIVAIVENP